MKKSLTMIIHGNEFNMIAHNYMTCADHMLREVVNSLVVGTLI